MSQEITIPTGDQLPAHLRGAAAAQTNDEFTSGVSAGAVLPFLSLRGKEFRLRWQGQERNLRVRELDVVFVTARANISKRWFATQYSAGSVEAPDCASTHGGKPDAGVSSPQHDSCASCPKNQFGSRITPNGKQGKACSDHKRIVVLPLINGQPIDTPVVVDVPAMSLKSPKGYQGQDMFLREYFGVLQKHGLPVTGVISTLGFTDAEFPQLCFGYKQPTDESLYNRVMELRESEDVQTMLDAELAEAPGPITEVKSTPELQPAPQPAPQIPVKQEPEPVPTPTPTAEGISSDVMGSVESFLQGSTGATPEPQAAAPRQEEQTSLPLEQPAPEPEKAQPKAAGGDLLAEVENLLGGL